jgi:hypothetical protein
MIFDAWGALWTGCFIVWLPAAVISAFARESSPWYAILLLVVGPVVLVMMAGVSRKYEVPVTSRLLARRHHEMPTGDRDYVLYLRSFLVDHALSGQDQVGGANSLTTLASYFGYRHALRLEKPWEDRITELLCRFGPVEAIGRPGEHLPPLGAKRIYLRVPEDRS